MSVAFQHNQDCWPDTMMGARVLLKKMTPTLENAELFYEAIQNNMCHLKDSFDFLIHKITTVDEAMSHLKKYQREAELGCRDNYGIFFDDTFIGVIFLCGDRYSEREVLYWLTEDACGHGFMNETLALIEQKHAELAPNMELFAIVNEKAKASAELLMNRGYVQTGVSFWKVPCQQYPQKVLKHSLKILQMEGHIYG